MNSRSTFAVPVALAVVHILLAFLFASATPYRAAGRVLTMRGTPSPDIGAPDERQHVNYVARIARGEGLAVFDPKDPNLVENYQGHQPPLYYVLAAGWTKLTGVSDPTQPNVGLPVRSLNFFLGATTVVGVYFLALWGFGRKEVAMGAGAFAALLPMHAALSGAASNDPLLIALSTWCLALCAKALATEEGWSTRLALGVGLTAGLAILTKTTGVALLLALLVAAVAKRPSAKSFAMVVGPLLVLVTPWWARNQQLYGDPLAMGAFNQAFVNSPQASMFIQGLGASTYWTQMVGWWTARSLIGVFGYMDIWLTSTGMPNGDNGLYQIALASIALGLVGWLAHLGRDAKKEEKPVHALLTAFLLVVVLLFLRFNAQYFQAQARYLLPAIAPLACFTACGWLSILRARPAVALTALLLPLLIADGLALSRLQGEFAKRTESAARNAE